jgi:hypothetical protein
MTQKSTHQKVFADGKKRKYFPTLRHMTYAKPHDPVRAPLLDFLALKSYSAFLWVYDARNRPKNSRFSSTVSA